MNEINALYSRKKISGPTEYAPVTEPEDKSGRTRSKAQGPVVDKSTEALQDLVLPDADVETKDQSRGRCNSKPR